MTQMVGRAQLGGQASPPTHRVVQIVELLSRHPDTRLSLARIVRETAVSRATAHAVLTQLTADGWTIRDEDGNYGIGPGLVTVARRAESAFPLRRLAAEPLRELAAHVQVPVFLAERAGDVITITEVVGTPPVDWIRPGRRLPLRPPVCREFVAWAEDAERRRWLDAADAATRPRLTAVLDAIRVRGYAVERLADESARMLDIIASLRDSPVTDPVRSRLGDVLTELITIDYLPDELGPENAVVTVAAPIRTTSGHTVASIVACPDNRLTATELDTLGKAVTDTADQVAHAMDGR